MQSNPVTMTDGEQETKSLSFAARLSGVYFEPRRTFEDIAQRPSWLGMFIILALLSIAASYAVTSRLDRETYLRKALQMNPLASRLSEEQIEQAVSRPPNALEKISPVLAPINVLLIYLVIAAVFLALWTLMSGGVTYRKSLAVTFWAYGAPGIVTLVLGTALMWVKDPDSVDINPINNIASNLGPLTDAKEHPALHSLLSSIDVFSAWTIALLAIGFAAASERRLSATATTAGVLVVWAVWALCKAGVVGLIS